MQSIQQNNWLLAARKGTLRQYGYHMRDIISSAEALAIDRDLAILYVWPQDLYQPKPENDHGRIV